MNATARARATRGPVRSIAFGCAVLASGAGLLLAGCGATESPSSSSGAGAAAAPNAGEHAPAGVPPAPAAGGSAQRAAGSGSQAAQLALATQSIIYTASMTVQASGGNVAAAVTKATGIVAAGGGYTAGEQETIFPGQHVLSVALLQLKIPVAAYPATLSKLETTLGQQTALSQQTQDVTQQVADVASRVTSAQAAITQLRALLKHAGSVSGLLSVQDQINSEETALEALQAQQRALAHQTSYATVSLTLVRHHPARVQKKKKSRNGFLAGLESGWRGFRAMIAWLLTVLGILLPFIVVAAVLAALGYLGRRRLLRRRPEPVTPTAAGPPGQPS